MGSKKSFPPLRGRLFKETNSGGNESHPEIKKLIFGALKKSTPPRKFPLEIIERPKTKVVACGTFHAVFDTFLPPPRLLIPPLEGIDSWVVKTFFQGGDDGDTVLCIKRDSATF